MTFHVFDGVKSHKDIRGERDQSVPSPLSGKGAALPDPRKAETTPVCKDKSYQASQLTQSPLLASSQSRVENLGIALRFYYRLQTKFYFIR